MIENSANTIGAYPVYNSNSNVQLFGQLLAKKQAKEDADAKALAAKLASMNSNGLRLQDQNQYYKKYKDLQGIAAQAYNTRDRQQKFNLQAQLDQGFNDLNQLVYNSKAKAARDQTMGMEIMKAPYLLSDEGKSIYHKSTDAETGGVGDVQDYTVLPLGHDMSKIPALIQSIQKPVLDMAQEQNPVYGIPYKVGNKTLTPVTNDYKVDNGKYAQAVKVAVLADDTLKAYLHQTYPALTEDQRVAQFVADNPISKPAKIGTPVENFKDTDKSMTDWQKYLVSRGYPFPPGSAPDKISQAEQVRLQMIHNMKNKVANSGEEIGAWIEGNPNFSTDSKFHIGRDTSDPNNVDKFIIDIPAQVKYDPDAQKYVIAVPRTKYNFRYSDPNFDTKMNALIGNVSGEHIDIGGSTGLKGNTRGAMVKATTLAPPAKKTIKSSDVSAKASAAGYTTKEYEKLLKANGVEIVK